MAPDPAQQPNEPPDHKPPKVSAPAPSFKPKATTLDDVSARLAVNRHWSDRSQSRGCWYGYARWVAVGIIAVMICAAAFIVASGTNLGRLVWVVGG